MPTPKVHIQTLLDLADVQINGSRPWDVVVHDDRFYRRVLSLGSVGLGESYMDGWWESPALDNFFFHVLGARLDERVRRNWPLLLLGLSSRLFNRQSRHHAFEIGKRHYDIGNDLYSAMLDSRLTYTCGYWKEASSLDPAQENKLELVCKNSISNPNKLCSILVADGEVLQNMQRKNITSPLWGFPSHRNKSTLARNSAMDSRGSSLSRLPHDQRKIRSHCFSWDV